MFSIIKKNELFFLENNGKDYIEFTEVSQEYSTKILDDTLQLKEHEFQDLIKNSSLKDFKLFCKISELSSSSINLLLTLGFDFSGVEYNPTIEDIEEIYTYQYKTEVLLKDFELHHILKKLEIE